MDGTVEAHNISFGCGHSVINITLPHGEYDWNHLKYQDFEQRSEKSGGEGGVTQPGYLSFISYQISLWLLHPPSTKWHTFLMLLVALWKIRPQWSKNNHSFQHFTSSGDALHSSISEPLQSHMMICSITYLFSAGEVQELKKGITQRHTHIISNLIGVIWVGWVRVTGNEKLSFGNTHFLN